MEKLTAQPLHVLLSTEGERGDAEVQITENPQTVQRWVDDLMASEEWDNFQLFATGRNEAGELKKVAIMVAVDGEPDVYEDDMKALGLTPGVFPYSTNQQGQQ